MAARGTATAVLTLVVAAAVTGCTDGASGTQQSPTPRASATTAKAQLPPVKGTVATNKKTPLSLREQPTISSKRLLRIPHKTAITMTCRTIGDTVSNGTHASNVWNKVTYKKKTGYVASVFVNADEAALSLCQAGAVKPTASVTSRPPNVEQAIVKVARGQRGVEGKKKKCNAYGGCMPWSSLFATWVWNKAGNVVPKFSFSGDLFTWGQKHNRAHEGTAGVGPGDLVLSGTGPTSPKTSTRVDVVVEVLANGKLKVIGGDIDNRVVERTIATKGLYGWVEA